MKKKVMSNRILGRRVAREMTREELDQATGGVNTWTLTYPADGPYADNGGGGKITSYT